MFHPFEINERVLVRVQFEDLIEEGAAGAENHLVTLDLFLILAGQRHVTELQTVVLPFECLVGTALPQRGALLHTYGRSPSLSYSVSLPFH